MRTETKQFMQDARSIKRSKYGSSKSVPKYGVMVLITLTKEKNHKEKPWINIKWSITVKITSTERTAMEFFHLSNTHRQNIELKKW